MRPVDVARTEFNVFLRYVMITITLLMSLIVVGTAK